MTKIIINGARGRMGQSLIACAAPNPQVQVVGQIDLGDELEPVIREGDVVMDFSSPEATESVVSVCAEAKTALVIGTTGHTETQIEHVRRFQSVIPMVWSSNYSTGVNALFWLTRKAAEILGPEFDLEVVEMHHRMKKDAPSGTAASLAQILAQVRGQQLSQVIRHGRQGLVGERSRNEIGMHSLRGGDAVGDHTVIFAAPGERVELTHKASSREAFATGALRAAIWVVKQRPGLYSMLEVLNLH